MSLILDGTNGVSDIDGTAATPAIRGTDTNTGIFFPAADTIAFSEGGTEVARFDSAGNLGIGTTSPSSKLHVAGGSGSTIRNVASAGSSWFVGSNVDSYILHNESNTPMLFTTNGTERMRIDSNGYVLIGKTAENNTSPGITLGRQESGTAPQQKMVKTFSGTVNAILNTHNGTYVGGMDFSNTTTSFPTSSDIRLKTNVVDAGSASEKIDQIRIVSHGWKHDDSVVEFGVVAQELYAVAPQSVTKGDDGEEIETAWGVDYSKLVPMLLKAHQEQQAIITELKATVDAQAARIAALESVGSA
jgi:hypothetical protein